MNLRDILMARALGGGGGGETPVSPSGGGGETWRLIKRITLEEDVAVIDSVSTDEDGNQFDLNAVRVVFFNHSLGASSTATSGAARVWVSTRTYYNAYTSAPVFGENWYIEVPWNNKMAFAEVVSYSERTSYRLTNFDSTKAGGLHNQFVGGNGSTIQRVALSTGNGNTQCYAAGSVIEIWGVDA